MTDLTAAQTAAENQTCTATLATTVDPAYQCAFRQPEDEATTARRRELFLVFIKNECTAIVNNGQKDCTYTFDPEDILRGSAAVDYLEYSANEAADTVIDSEDPEFYVEDLLNVVESYASDLRLFLKTFRDFCNEQEGKVNAA